MNPRAGIVTTLLATPGGRGSALRGDAQSSLATSVYDQVRARRAVCVLKFHPSDVH